MSITSEPRTCPKCGGPILAEAPEGLCPKCLLQGVSMPTEAGKGAPPKGAPPTREAVAAAFPHLEILEFIGQGGMGFVFKARQPKLDRFAALKILPQSLAADPAFAERFIREGRLLARLTHPEIVAVHDFGQANGFFYLLMEYVDGVNLRQAMKVRRFTPAQALAIVPRICEALQFAHNEGILHRDIKPENILLDAKGRVKIADFGIAKLMGEPGGGTILTDKGSALGTPHYMAPEQLEHPQDVDQRADIYSLGVVFYEMLTGELPIGRFAPPSEKSTVDPRVDEVVLRTLEKERERRTQTAGEVGTQVETIAATPAPAGSRRGEARPAFVKPNAEWRKRMPLLSPLQSPEVRDICAHLTKAESNRVALLGLLIGVWVVAAVFGIPFLIKSFPSPGNWIAGSAFGIIFFVSLPMLSGIGRQFLCSTAWAKEQGFRPEHLNLFSLRGNNFWKGLGILLVLLLLVLVQHIAITRYLGLSAQTKLNPAPERQQNGAATSRAPTQTQAGKTLRLWNATNVAQRIDLETGPALLPGEILVMLTKLPDGRVETNPASLSISHRPDGTRMSSGLGWSLPDYFGTREVESAVFQLRRNVVGKPVMLAAGEPLALFSVTNQFGDAVSGYLEFRRFGPKPPGDATGPEARVHGSVSLKHPVPPFGTWVYFTASVPPGYIIQATASPSDYEFTSFSSKERGLCQASWSSPALFSATRMQDASRQLEQLAKQGPIDVFLGEPRQVFAITNEAGKVYRGFFELVGPPAAAGSPSQPAPAGGPDLAASLGPLTKTVVLTRATNHWVGASNETQNVGVWTDTTVGPGEALVALVKRPEGTLEEARSLQFVHAQPDGVKTSTSLSWFFGSRYTPGFGESAAEAAATQLRENMSDKALTLTAGEPLELFAVTNQSGGVLAGYVKYVRSVPQPPERRGSSVVRPQAIVHIRGYAPYIPSINYSVKLPPGYALRATANMGEVSTHFSPASKSGDSLTASVRPPSGDYYSAWFLTPSMRGDSRDYPAQMRAQQAALGEQFQELLDRGPIPVVLGERCQVFALTNKDGEVYRGFFELVAPSAGGSTTNGHRTQDAPIMPPGQAAKNAPRPHETLQTSLPGAGSIPTAQATRVPGRVPASAETFTPKLDPAGNPVPPGATSSGPPRTIPATRLPLPPNSAATASPLLDPATGMPVPPGPSSAVDPVTGLPIPVGSTGTGRRSTSGGPYDLPDEARELTAKGHYETALQRYLSYYEQTRTYHTRPPLSLALEGWVELGRKYPKARQALVEIQERDTRAFSQDQGSVELFHELAQINDALHQEEATYALFKAMERADPPLAKQCYLYAEDLLVRRGEYELCRNCLGDVQQRYRIGLGTYKMEQDSMSRLLSRTDTSVIVKKSSDDRFVGQTCRWVEILVGTGGKAEADKLRDQALTDLNDPRLKSAVSDAEERVRKARASPRPALAQSALREPLIPGPTRANTNFTEPSASVERWQPSLAPGQKPNLDGIRGEAKVLATGGHYEEALQRHLWYHNHALEYDPNQRGVRLSFVLADWVELGRKYPKAKQALLEIRDGNTRKLVEGRGSSQLFKDVDAINRQYGSEDATYALFKTVQERDPALAHRCYNVVEDLLVKKGEYALCLTCLGDCQERFASIRQDWEKGRSWEDNMSRKLQRIPSRPGVPSFAPPPYYDKHFVEETRRLIEILVGTGHKAEAGKIQEQAVAALDDARLKSAVADAEKRTRN